MAAGRPDFHPTMLFEGKYGNTLVPVVVDENGQLFALMKGSTGTTYVPLKVDADGQITAIIKGEYLGAPAAVALDSNGLIKVNLSVQDLNYSIVRPVVGETISTRSINYLVSAGTERVLQFLGAKGRLLSGWLSCDYGSDVGLLKIRIYTNYGMRFEETFDDIYSLYPLGGRGGLVSCNRYIPSSGSYRFIFADIFSYEVEVSIAVYNPYGFDVTVSCVSFYDLIV